MDVPPSQLTGLVVALGGGLLIGIDRERHKGTGPYRSIAGMRTFALAGISGTLTQAIGNTWLVVLGAGLIVMLSAIAYVRERSDDPGITTECALFLTYVLGVAAAIDAPLASGAFVIVAALLASKTRLHHFAKDTLTEAELRDGLLLAAAALVIYPLVPDRAFAPVAGANPHHLWRLVILLMSLQAIGYMGLRLIGARFGLALAGLVSGMVSSSSTFAAMGARSKAQPALVTACAASALASNLSSMSLLVIVAVTIHAQVLEAIWTMLAAGLGTGAVVVAVALRTSDAGAADLPAGRVFSIRHALGFSALLTALTGAVSLVTERYGAMAAEIAAALAATIDLQAAAGALFSLAAGGGLGAVAVQKALLIAISVNAASKAAIAFMAGGLPFGARTAAGLLITIVSMWTAFLIA